MNKYKPENLLISKEVSGILRIPLPTIYRLTQQGKIKAIKVGKRWLYHKEVIEKYLQYGTAFSKEPARNHPQPAERRAYPRINSNFKCYYATNLPPYKNISGEGIIKNLGAGGVFLNCQNGDIDIIEIDDPIDLDFNIMSKNAIINVAIQGRIVRKDSNSFGIKFRDLSNEVKDKIISYVG